MTGTYQCTNDRHYAWHGWLLIGSWCCFVLVVARCYWLVIVRVCDASSRVGRPDSRHSSYCRGPVTNARRRGHGPHNILYIRPADARAGLQERGCEPPFCIFCNLATSASPDPYIPPLAAPDAIRYSSPLSITKMATSRCMYVWIV